MQMDENRKNVLRKVMYNWSKNNRFFETEDIDGEEAAFWQTFVGLYKDIGGEPDSLC